jgi:hypothetical protein
VSEAGGNAAPDDPVLAAIDEVVRAGAGVHEAVDPVVDALLEARAARAAGMPLPKIVGGLVERGGRSLRLTPALALREMERAVTAYRVAAIRELVDEHGLTFTEIAELTGVSRQMVGRLYKSG